MDPRGCCSTNGHKALLTTGLADPIPVLVIRDCQYMQACGLSLDDTILEVANFQRVCQGIPVKLLLFLFIEVKCPHLNFSNSVLHLQGQPACHVASAWHAILYIPLVQ